MQTAEVESERRLWGGERLLCGLLVLGALVADVSTPWPMNFAILYLIVPLMCARSLAGSRLLGVAGLLIVLTYGAYVLKVAATGTMQDHPEVLLSYRLINRTFVAAGVLAAAYVVHYSARLRSQAKKEDETAWALRMSAYSWTRRDGLLLKLGMLTLVLPVVVDFLTPGQINVTMLYLIPLALVSLLRSKRLLWMLVVAVLLLTAAGYWWGPAPTVERGAMWTMSVNRILAGLTLVVAGLRLGELAAGGIV